MRVTLRVDTYHPSLAALNLNFPRHQNPPVISRQARISQLDEPIALEE